MKKHNNIGFSIFELIAVILIISIVLASTGVVNFIKYKNNIDQETENLIWELKNIRLASIYSKRDIEVDFSKSEIFPVADNERYSAIKITQLDKKTKINYAKFGNLKSNPKLIIFYKGGAVSAGTLILSRVDNTCKITVSTKGLFKQLCF